jgi:DNA polymerase-3 subunit delta'
MIPHSYLFCGIAGVGKKRMAAALAMVLNCDAPVENEACGACPSCRNVTDGNSSNFLIIEPEAKGSDGLSGTTKRDKVNILIDQIRELNRKINFAPLGKYRVCVVDQTDKMTIEAANSFLKTLEEPPPGNVFILNAVDPIDLLPTILSRCRKVPFQPVSIKKITEWLVTEKGTDHESAEIMARMSAGSPGNALEMLAGDFLERRGGWLSSLMKLPALSMDDAFQLSVAFMEDARKTGSGKAEFLEMLGVWKTWYRDILFIKEQAPLKTLINMDYSYKLEKIAGAFMSDGLLESLHVLDKAEQNLARNRNISLVTEHTIMDLWRFARNR